MIQGTCLNSRLLEDLGEQRYKVRMQKELVDDDVDRIQEETGNAGKTAPKAPTSIKKGKPSYMTLAVGETKLP